jgi:hypothetical protein
MSRRAKQFPAAVRRTLRHPGWMWETVRLAWKRTREPEPGLAEDHLRYLSDEATAMTALFGPAAHGLLRQPTSQPRVAKDLPLSRWSGGRTLVNVVGTAVTVTKPDVVLETGVAAGITSATALAAMQSNGRGHLYSIDLPPLGTSKEADIGGAIPPELRERWTLEVGPSRILLPKMVERLGSLDIFLADADHSYASQLAEYRTAWPALRDGGLLISDDVANLAFVTFAREVGVRPYLIHGPGETRPRSVVGVLRKDA